MQGEKGLALTRMECLETKEEGRERVAKRRHPVLCDGVRCITWDCAYWLTQHCSALCFCFSCLSHIGVLRCRLVAGSGGTSAGGKGRGGGGERKGKGKGESQGGGDSDNAKYRKRVLGTNAHKFDEDGPKEDEEPHAVAVLVDDDENDGYGQGISTSYDINYSLKPPMGSI